MKNLILFTILFMLGLIHVKAQELPYTVTGKVTSWPTEQVYLVRQGNYPGADSALVQDGNFAFKGSIPGPTLAYLMTDKKKGVGKILFVEPGDIVVEGDFDTFNDVEITGSPTYQEFQELNKNKELFQQQMYENVESQLSAPDSLTRKEVAADMDKIGAADKAFSYNFIKKHPSSLVSLIEIKYRSRFGDYPILKELFDGLSEKLKESPEGKETFSALENMPGKD